MRRPTTDHLRSAVRWARWQAKGLLRTRRAQLVFAVLFGAIIGAGLMAAASVGVGGHERDGFPGFSSTHHPGNEPGWHFGPDGDGR